jgi:hypothetical protein
MGNTCSIFGCLACDTCDDKGKQKLNRRALSSGFISELRALETIAATATAAKDHGTGSHYSEWSTHVTGSPWEDSTSGHAWDEQEPLMTQRLTEATLDQTPTLTAAELDHVLKVTQTSRQSAFGKFGHYQLSLPLAVLALVSSLLVLFLLTGAAVYCFYASKRKTRARKVARMAPARQRSNEEYLDNVETGNYSKLSEVCCGTPVNCDWQY